MSGVVRGLLCTMERMRTISVILALSSVSGLAQAQAPQISLIALNQQTSEINIEDVSDPDKLRLEWCATVSSDANYRFQIVYDAAKTVPETPDEGVLVEVDEDPDELVNVTEDVLTAGCGGTGQGFTYILDITRAQILADTENGGTLVRDRATRSLAVYVYNSADRFSDGQWATAEWSFSYDTQPPPAPTITEVVAGERRAEIRWDAPASTGDVDGYRVYSCSDVVEVSEVANSSVATSTPGAESTTLGCRNDAWVVAEENVGREQRSISVTNLPDLAQVAFAVRSIDSFQNLSALSNVQAATTINVTDFFEYYNRDGVSEDGGFCFLATAAYGSYAHPAVRLLRMFRDFVLLRLPGGDRVVGAYYLWSPAIAKKVSTSVELRALVRALLWPVIFCLLVGFVGIPMVVFFRFLRALRTKRAKQGAAAILLVASWIFSSSADAAPRPPADSGIGFGLELRGGPYLPALGNASQENDAFTTIFGDSPNPLYGVAAELQLYRGIGTAGVGGFLGFMQFVGRARAPGTDTATTDTTVFNILPLNLVAFYRFDWLIDHTWIPLVPYVRGGFAYHLWWATTGNGDTAETTQPDGSVIKGRGGKRGLTGTVGISLYLNALDAAAGRAMHQNSGIRATYIFVELQTSQVDDFGGAGFDLSETNWNAGLFFEF